MQGGYIQFGPKDDGATPVENPSGEQSDSSLKQTQDGSSSSSSTVEVATKAEDGGGKEERSGSGSHRDDADDEHERKTLDSVAGDELTTNELDLCAVSTCDVWHVALLF